MTDWTDPTSKVSNHFTVRECTWLPSWGCCHQPSDAEKAALTRMAQKMDQIRDLVGKPINIHVWIRPQHANCPGNDNDGGDYNALVGGAAHSAHVPGLAVDWDCGEDCDTTRATLLPHLETLGIRMENKPAGRWVHTDVMPPNPHRFFIP